MSRRPGPHLSFFAPAHDLTLWSLPWIERLYVEPAGGELQLSMWLRPVPEGAVMPKPVLCPPWPDRRWDLEVHGAGDGPEEGFWATNPNLVGYRISWDLDPMRWRVMLWRQALITPPSRQKQK